MKIKNIGNVYSVKECPFCGKIESVEFANLREEEECNMFDDDRCPAFESCECSGVYVICSVNKGGCGASSGFAWRKDKAVELWNRRGGGTE